jgi:hypothetical protein
MPAAFMLISHRVTPSFSRIPLAYSSSADGRPQGEKRAKEKALRQRPTDSRAAKALH